jgi:hypothetical protein
MAGKAGMDILAGMDIFGKSGIAANSTYNASHPALHTGSNIVADTTEFLPNMGRNYRHIPGPVHYGCLEQTNIKT